MCGGWRHWHSHDVLANLDNRQFLLLSDISCVLFLCHTEEHSDRLMFRPLPVHVAISTNTTATLHPFTGLYSRTTWLIRYQKGKTSLDLNEARDDGVLGCSGIS